MTSIRSAATVLAAMVIGLMAGRIVDATVWALVATAGWVGVAAIALSGFGGRLRAAGLAAACVVSIVTTPIVVGGSVTDAFVGPAAGLRRLVSTEWPSPLDPAVAAALATLVAVTTAIAVELASRTARPLAPLAPLVVAATIVVALSAPSAPEPSRVVTLGVLAAVIVLFRPTALDADSATGRPAVERLRTLAGERSLVLAALVVGGAAIVTTAATARVLADDARADPRRPPAADRSASLVDPIEATVALRDAEPPIAVFTVIDRSTLVGPGLPARWRTAALDEYDGQRWVPRITLRPIGRRLAPSAPSRPTITYDLQILDPRADLVPVPGRPIAVDASIATDSDRVTVRLVDEADVGAIVRVTAETAPVTAAATASVATRQVDDIAATFSDVATELGGDGTVIERLGRIATTMRTEWQLDPTGGGLQLALVDRFVNDTRRGTREQFVTAFTLLVRSLGFDARVATGFVVPPGAIASPLTLSSTYAAAWPEVLVDDHGWVPFDPVPTEITADDREPPPPPEAQSPAAVQPPIAPPSERADDVDPADDPTETSDSWASVGAWVVRSAIAVGLTIVPLLVVAGGIVGVKWWRRRRRLRAPDPLVRIRGAWANTTDSFVDAGLAIEPSWTDHHIAGVAAPLAPAAPHEVRRLATVATAATFGSTPAVDTDRLAIEAVATARVVDAAILADRSRWRRWRRRLSVRSLRRATRSPVSA